LDRGDEDDGLATAQAGERSCLVAARERGAEHRIGAGFGWCDRAPVPDERRRRRQRVEGVPHGEGATERRDDRETGAADGRERTTGLVHRRHSNDERAPGVSLEKVAQQGRIPAQHDA